MSAREQEAALQERVGKLETRVDNVTKGVDEVKQEIRGLNVRFDAMYALMSSWLKWMLGMTFTSWLTLMAAILLKK